MKTRDGGGACAFLARHGMSPASADPERCIGPMLAEMEHGLAGEPCSMDMIPTWLSVDGELHPGACAAVIDAGGTNFRRALLCCGPDGWQVSELRRWRMPGADAPCGWSDFIRFAADAVEPLLEGVQALGFCFSYAARITPERDGLVERMDKELDIRGCEGRAVGASLREELLRRGLPDCRVAVLNDTTAALLGGASALDRNAYSALIGQVSGTGTNTCVSLPVSRIGKLGLAGEGSMIVNLESGKYDGVAGGDFDRLLDAASRDPGRKRMEKLSAGGYLGPLCGMMLRAAADEGLLSPAGTACVRELGPFDAALLDAWALGEELERLGEDAADRLFAKTLALALFERSAACMCGNLLALTLLAGGGRDKPACVLAEGSLIRRGRAYRTALERLLRVHGLERRGLSVELRVGEETTLPGAAAAALLGAG